MNKIALATIKIYQIAISPHLPSFCRYQPTCSHYAYEAISRHGIRRGSMMTLIRLLRCSPFGHMGADPVP